MFAPTIELERHIYDKLRVAAQIGGASSIEGFACRVLETKADEVIAGASRKDATPEEIEEISNKLKGLGYLE